jgi:hypothetical protein
MNICYSILVFIQVLMHFDDWSCASMKHIQTLAKDGDITTAVEQEQWCISCDILQELGLYKKIDVP